MSKSLQNLTFHIPYGLGGRNNNAIVPPKSCIPFSLNISAAYLTDESPCVNSVTEIVLPEFAHDQLFLFEFLNYV